MDVGDANTTRVNDDGVDASPSALIRIDSDDDDRRRFSPQRGGKRAGGGMSWHGDKGVVRKKPKKSGATLSPKKRALRSTATGRAAAREQQHHHQKTILSYFHNQGQRQEKSAATTAETSAEEAFVIEDEGDSDSDPQGGLLTRGSTVNASATPQQPTAVRDESKAERAGCSMMLQSLPRLSATTDCPYSVLADAFAILEKTTSRKLITATLRTTFCSVLKQTEVASSARESCPIPDPSALVAAVYLSTNGIAPSYENVELSVGSRIVSKAIQAVTGLSPREMSALYKKLGDLGDVAAAGKRHQRTLVQLKPLGIKGVYRQLHDIATIAGKGSVSSRSSIITKLLLSCQGNELRYIVRTLIGNLRTGAVGLTLQTAMAQAIVDYRGLAIAYEEAAELLKLAYARCPSWEIILNALLSQESSDPFRQLALATKPAVGIPLRNMLANITRDINDAVSKMQGRDFQAEFKYDGVRAQIHLSADPADSFREGARLYMFSRHLENVSDRYPDVLESVLDALVVASATERKEFDSMLDEVMKLTTSQDLKEEEKGDKKNGDQHAILDHRIPFYVPKQTQPTQPPSHAADRLERAAFFVQKARDNAAYAMQPEPTAQPQHVQLKVHSCILDAEVVAIDPTTETLLPFQTLMSRGKKNVSLDDINVPVCVFVYDLLFVNGASLLQHSLRERCHLLHNMFREIPGRFRFVESKTFEAGQGREHCDGKGTDAGVALDTDARSRASSGDMVEKSGTSRKGKSKEDGGGKEGTGLQGGELVAAGCLEQSESLNTEEGDQNGIMFGHDVGGLRAFFSKAITSKCEGIMVKALGPPLGTHHCPSSTTSSSSATQGGAKDVALGLAAEMELAFAQCTYQPSKRCENWLKVKKDYVDGISDTLDLVVIGGWSGNGRKAGWISPFLLACYDEESDSFHSVCKVMSGFTDDFYKATTKEYLREHVISSKRADYVVDAKLHPTYWFNPVHVWEIKGADLTSSPLHTACRGMIQSAPANGVSVRFPRFVRVRDDKGVYDATSPDQLASMYNKQFQ